MILHPMIFLTLVISFLLDFGTSFVIPRNNVHRLSVSTAHPHSGNTFRNNYALSKLSNQLSANAKKENDEEKAQSPSDDLNPLAKASWYAVESFGKLFGSSNNGKNDNSNITTKSKVQVDLSRAPSSIQETIERIKLDNDRYYFLSGQVDRLCYAEDCIFSDPFVSFEGRDRFVDNLQNLGSFVTEYDVKQLGYDVNQNDEVGTTVDTKVMVKLELNLPWKPILAWPWGVKYDIDSETYLISNHKESWDIDPWEGVKQIFKKPTRKIRKE